MSRVRNSRDISTPVTTAWLNGPVSELQRRFRLIRERIGDLIPALWIQADRQLGEIRQLRERADIIENRPFLSQLAAENDVFVIFIFRGEGSEILTGLLEIAIDEAIILSRGTMPAEVNGSPALVDAGR